jgi:hypothetical protein
MKIVLFLVISIILVSASCNKNGTNPVPNIPFDITIDINLPSYSNLSGVGGWAYVNGGSRGIIVYRRAIDEFIAFDRHSPADPEGTCFLPLFPDNENFLQLNDTCNNATFSLYDGSPITNSQFGLRQYRTVFNGTDLLRVYN